MQAFINKLSEREQPLLNLKQRLESQAPSTRIELQTKQVQFLIKQLKGHMSFILERKQSLLANQAGLLNSVSPLATLSRGYSVVRKVKEEYGGHKVLTKSGDVSVGEEVNILLHEGQIDCTVTKCK